MKDKAARTLTPGELRALEKPFGGSHRARGTPTTAELRQRQRQA